MPKGENVGHGIMLLAIDVKNINMVLSLYVFEILNLRRDNVVGCAEDIARGAEESCINLKLRRDSLLIG
jgi:hypothetical protein